MSVSRTRDVLGLTAFVALCFGVSVLGGMATRSALSEWYPALRKPAWTPPGWVFGPVWTLLYPLVAVAGWLAWRDSCSGRRPSSHSADAESPLLFLGEAILFCLEKVLAHRGC